MPPRLHRLCVDGSGPNVSWCCSARARSVSRITPGCTRAIRCSTSISRIRFMYLVKSSTTATLQLWPARLVPEPRARIGAPNDRHTAAAIETDFSAHDPSKLAVELGGPYERVDRFAVRTEGEDHLASGAASDFCADPVSDAMAA